MKNLKVKTNSSMVEKSAYIAPQMSIVEVAVEKMFASSQQEPSEWEEMALYTDKNEFFEKTGYRNRIINSKDC